MDSSLFLSSACTVNRSQRNNSTKGNSLTNNGHQGKAHTGLQVSQCQFNSSQREEIVNLLNKTQGSKYHLAKNLNQNKAIHSKHHMASNNPTPNNIMPNNNRMASSSSLMASSPITTKIKTHHSRPRMHHTTLRVAPRTLPID
jgi:hypothetical protein